MSEAQSPVVSVPRALLSEAAGILDCEGYGPISSQLNAILSVPPSPAGEGLGSFADAHTHRADGQVASQREVFGWWVEHTVAEPMLIRPPSFCPAGPNYRITPLYTSPTDQSSDVSGLVEMVADLIEKHTYVMSRHHPDMARVAGHNACAQEILKALAQAKRDGGEG